MDKWRSTGLRRGVQSACSHLRRWRGTVAASVLVVLALLAVSSLSLPASGATRDLSDSRATANSVSPSEIASQASTLRQLDIEPVPVRSMNRDELRDMLLEDSEEDLEEIGVTQDLFVFLDLLEEGQNLRDIMVEAYTEEVLGFYDAETKDLCLISESSDLSPLDRLTLAHEYTHAIQDQQFDLTELDEGSADSETSMATQALVEGDATLVMGLYYWTYLDEEERAAVGEMSAEPGMGEDVPAVIQETMMFPYEYGLQFVLALIDEGKWKAVNDAYRDPPKSTEQIMHPEKYIDSRDDPIALAMPDVAAALGPEWSEVDSDIFGEFGFKLYLEAFLDSSEAEAAAAGWGGDRYAFLENEAGGKVFVLKSEWDTADDAREFYDACVARAQKRSGDDNTVSGQDSGAASWESEGLSCRLELDGTSVRLVIAPDAETANTAMSAVSRSTKSSNMWLYVGVGIGAGLVCLLCIIAALLLRRRRHPKPAIESVASQSGPNPQ